jgi:hypothetical protein
MGKLKVVNKELINNNTEQVIFENNKSKMIKQSFKVEPGEYQKKSSFMGFYRDIVEYVDSGNIEIRKEQNDISEMF